MAWYVLALVNIIMCGVKIYEHQPGWLPQSLQLLTIAIMFWCIGSGRLVWVAK